MAFDNNSLQGELNIRKTGLNVNKKKPEDWVCFPKPSGGQPDKKLSQWEKGHSPKGFDRVAQP
jgi:hypothetical protein